MTCHPTESRPVAAAQHRIHLGFMETQAAITDLLLECRADDRAGDRLFPVVYEELRRVAHLQLRRERPGHTLGTTALVNEAYLKLVDITRVEWRDRVHFLSMAARAMRRILVDYARQHCAERRGRGIAPMALDAVQLSVDDQADELVALDDALERLASLNPRLVQVVEYRFFAGLSEDETARALAVTTRTVRRDWVKARGWLRHALGGSPERTA
jgi:RNA polymerase sigma factor (TIGR02999 family)